MPKLTHLLDAAASGDSTAASELLPLVYGELRRLAAARMANENPGQTLQATALVHEAYLRLVGKRIPSAGTDETFANRAHFFAAAAEAMRRILVEAARRKNRIKHGGGRNRVDLDQVPILTQDTPAIDVVELSHALDALEREDATKAQLVKLRYFAGLTLEDTAAALGISLATAKRRWTVARAWLYDRLTSCSS